jgi:hypothetical protein
MSPNVDGVLGVQGLHGRRYGCLPLIGQRQPTDASRTNAISIYSSRAARAKSPRARPCRSDSVAKDAPDSRRTPSRPLLDEHPNLVLGNPNREVGGEPVGEPRRVISRFSGQFERRRDCDWLHRCVIDAGIRGSGSLTWPGLLKPQASQPASAGISASPATDPLLGLHSES